METSFVSTHGSQYACAKQQLLTAACLVFVCVKKQHLGDIVDDFRDSCTVAFGANFRSVLHGIDQDGSTNL